RPPQTRRQRLVTMIALSAALDLTLLSALTCFFPWELAASLSVPGYEFPFSAFTHYATGNLRWLLTPIELAKAAESLPLYLSGIVIAIPLFILLPPFVLFATYFNGLVQLEGIHQEIKSYDAKE
ncbi:MAG: hypothetical protein L0Z53_18620, partial [Acidobacteriales bacterium]|nr:hypothetical protein [Terriglobales bacterium]